MAFERVGFRAVIEGLNVFNRDAKIVNDRLQQVTRQVGQLDEKAGRARGLKDFGERIKEVSGDLLIVGGAMTAVGAASGAFLFQATQLAGRVETLGVVTATLGRNVGKTESEIRELEQAIRAQGITLQSSRSAIALMIQSNIDLAHSVDLARLAQNAAVIAGINSSEAFEHLIGVIVSGNVTMARTLGLQVSFQQAYEDTAKSLGKSTLALTEQEKVAARTQAVLASGVNIADAYANAMDTVGKKVTSLDRHIEEARRELGEQWLPIYGAAIDLLTESLKAWTDLDQSMQRIIGSGALIVASTGLVLGNMALWAAAIPRVVGALRVLGGAVGVSTGALGLMALAIGAVVAAGVSWANFVADLRQKQAQLSRVVRDHTNELLRNSNTTEEYNREVQRLNRVIADQGFLGTLLTRRLEELSAEEFEVAKRAAEMGLGMGEAGQAMSDTETAAGDAADEFSEMAAAEAEATRQAEFLERQQESLRDKLKEVELGISTDITPKFDDFRDSVEDLQKQLQDLEVERIGAIAELKIERTEDVETFQKRIRDLSIDLEIAKERLNEMGEATSNASRLAAEARIDDLSGDLQEAREQLAGLTGDSGERLAELEGEYAEKMAGIRDQIDETTKAWERQTAEIIFNLATQRLGIGGFTREEIAALTALAGPEGLGLIDEAGVALIERIDEINSAMEASGDQSGFFAEDMSKLAEIMADPTQAAEDLAAALRDVESATIAYMEATSIELPGRRLRPTGTRVSTRQFGGPALAGRSYLVGETGPEMFLPRQSGAILPNRMLSAMTAMAQAVTSAIPVPGALVPAMAAQGATPQQNFNMTVNTSAPREPIIADFNLLALQAGRR